MVGSRTRLVTVEEVGARLEEWRRNRQGRGAIPDELWSAASEVARRDGVNRTARALRLDGDKLKRRMLGAAEVAQRAAAPGFVELIASAGGALAQCAIELEGRRGRIRIELKGTAAELANFSRTLGEAVL